MWTTKRLLLLLAGFTLFFSLYLVYAFFLGGIDGLPPLPEELAPGSVQADDAPRPGPRINVIDKKVQLAFGPGWEELLKCSIKLEINSKNMVVLAKDFEILEDGRVKLWPFNVAIFGKDSHGQFPEINTVQSKVAFLTFDQPVVNIAEMGNRKITAGELRGDIKVYNNRRSLQRDDDMSLTTPGPLYYNEAKNLIWTAAPVDLVDTQRKPEPTIITAVGMDLELTPGGASKPNKPKSKLTGTVSGVDRIRLHSTVAMHMWVDGDSGFLNNGGTPAKNGAAPKDPAKLVITTEGSFLYEVNTDQAYFEIPKEPSRLGERVKVTRLSGPNHEKHDKLECDRLDIQFIRKGNESAKNDRGAVNLTIKDAHATGRQVTLASDAEGLHAIGNDFFYKALERESILKGDPELVAMKDGHEIYARELRLVNLNDKTKQEAYVKGPGRIAMLDKATTQRTMFAYWKDQLVLTRDGNQDLLILTEDASFEDRASGQKLGADRLKVWFEPKKEAGSDNSESARNRPSKLEATGNVRAESAELIITPPTELLMVYFEDAPATGGPLPEQAASNTPGQPGNRETTQPGVAGPPTAQAPNKEKKPLVVNARAIETFVARQGNRNDIKRVRCDGNVHVHQDPNPNEERGVEIHGNALRLDCAPEGSILVVNGDLAQVQLNKINIIGAEVNIDQRANKAWVDGRGVMQILTNRDLNGKMLKTPTELTIHWNDKMLFNGQYAIFHGNVQGEQHNDRLLCKEMTVLLDKTVSLKEGQRSSEAAKIRELVCDKSVRMETTTRDEQTGKLARYSRLTSPWVTINNEDSKLNATGPGVVHILQPGAADDFGSGPKEKAGQPKEMVLKLTRVNYLGRLYADNVKNSATFYGSVEVVHAPTDNPDQVIDPDHPVAGSFFLSCEQLKVFSHKHADGSATQEMEARDRVFIESKEFSGRCSVLKYDESKELIILEGGENGMATLYRVKAPGAPHEKFTGKKIKYWRLKNEIGGEGVESIGVQ